MLYAIISEDVKDSLKLRMKVRKHHLARLHKLQRQGHLLLAGPHPAIDTTSPGEAGFTGSLIVAEFSDVKAAQSWADADPYITAGVYSKVVVKPFKKVLP